MERKLDRPFSLNRISHEPSDQASYSARRIEQDRPAQEGLEAEEVQRLRNMDRSDVELLVSCSNQTMRSATRSVSGGLGGEGKGDGPSTIPPFHLTKARKARNVGR